MKNHPLEGYLANTAFLHHTVLQGKEFVSKEEGTRQYCSHEAVSGKNLFFRDLGKISASWCLRCFAVESLFKHLSLCSLCVFTMGSFPCF